jgi:hypothetical protein
MSKTVVYEGSTSRADRSDAYNIRDEKGNMVRLPADRPTEVSDELGAYLLGDDSPTGHKFSEAQTEETSKSPRRSGGGSGGSGQAGGGGTTSAAART